MASSVLEGPEIADVFRHTALAGDVCNHAAPACGFVPAPAINGRTDGRRHQRPSCTAAAVHASCSHLLALFIAENQANMAQAAEASTRRQVSDRRNGTSRGHRACHIETWALGSHATSMPAFATHPNLVIASPPGVVACSAFCSTCYHSASSQRPRVASVLRPRAHALGRSLVLRHPGSRSTQTPSRLAPIWRRRRPLLYRVAPLPFAAADDACEGFCSTRNCSQLTTTGCDNLSPPGRARRVLHRPRSSKMIGLFAVPVAEQKSPSPSRRAARAKLPFRRGYAVSESPG